MSKIASEMDLDELINTISRVLPNKEKQKFRIFIQLDYAYPLDDEMENGNYTSSELLKRMVNNENYRDKFIKAINGCVKDLTEELDSRYFTKLYVEPNYDSISIWDSFAYIGVSIGISTIEVSIKELYNILSEIHPLHSNRFRECYSVNVNSLYE